MCGDHEINTAKDVFSHAAASLYRAAMFLDEGFNAAVDLMYQCRGRVVISGMGKSGLIGQKLSATLASTGTPSFPMHPADALHGDLGMVTSGDVAVLISYSGETEELVQLIPALTDIYVPIIAIVGVRGSTLANNADAVLNVPVISEACPNNLAPTTSTTVAMVMGDALAVALIKRRNFTPQQFAVFHPGGSLGRRLLTRVKEVMVPAPVNEPDDSFRDVIINMTRSGIGVSVICDPDNGEVCGIITDGDLRRALLANKDISFLTASQVMSHNPHTINEEERFADAEKMMYELRVTVLVVLNREGRLSGVVKLQDTVSV